MNSIIVEVRNIVVISLFAVLALKLSKWWIVLLAILFISDGENGGDKK